jgi:phosphoribosylanthranilate isomerase
MRSCLIQLIMSSTSKELVAYSKAGNIATEVFSCIKTVLVFDGQDKECLR